MHIHHRGRHHRLYEDKYLLFADHGIPTPSDDGELNDVIAFGFTVAEFFRILKEQNPDLPVLGQFHEWMAGVAVPRIAHLRIPMAT